VGGAALAWILTSSWLAYRGAYLAHNEECLLILVGIAMPYLLLGVLATSQDVRELLSRFAAGTPPASLAAVHTVRVLALGTIYKWWLGALPGHFILPVAVPDFLIGLSAPFVSRSLARGRAGSRRLFAAWNLIGALVLLMAPPLIQLSQPGPLQRFTTGPNTDEVLGFPMSIVPTFVAPVLILLHVAALVGLARRRDREGAITDRTRTRGG
jgi:hypothetical protein